MKKILTLLLLFTIATTLTACNLTPTREPVDCELYPTHVDCLEDTDPVVDCEVDPTNELCEPEEPADFLDIYYINDFHGSILPASDQLGMAYMANYLVTKKEENPDKVIIMAGGDILQGSALSNYYNGLSTINMMNEMYFDSFTIGNHEFDWGLDTLTNYFDNDDSNGEAVFPLLGANVFIEGTTELPEHIDPYLIIERSGMKIGIIGTIGYGLESSIATSKISGFEFADPVPIIEEYSHYLRTVENVDLVFVVSHDSGNINDDVAALTGDYKVNAIFNGHSHSRYANTDDGLPIIQSGSNGEYLGHIRFTFDENGDLSTFFAENLDFNDSDLFHSTDSDVQDLIDGYQLETDELFNTPLLVSGEYMSQGDLTSWIAQLMRITTGADVAFHNTGGTRTNIDDGEMVTLGLLYQIWPFDNFIKTTYLTGEQIKYFSGATRDPEVFSYDDDTYYLVATNDYVFDKDYYPFINGINPINTGLLLRDIVVSELELQKILFESFLLENTILSTALIPIPEPPVQNTSN